jgi:hypothetical protein
MSGSRGRRRWHGGGAVADTELGVGVEEVDAGVNRSVDATPVQALR